jgi:hypothetical protein
MIRRAEYSTGRATERAKERMLNQSGKRLHATVRAWRALFQMCSRRYNLHSGTNALWGTWVSGPRFLLFYRCRGHEELNPRPIVAGTAHN